MRISSTFRLIFFVEPGRRSVTWFPSAAAAGEVVEPRRHINFVRNVLYSTTTNNVKHFFKKVIIIKMSLSPKVNGFSLFILSSLILIVANKRLKGTFSITFIHTSHFYYQLLYTSLYSSIGIF